MAHPFLREIGDPLWCETGVAPRAALLRKLLEPAIPFWTKQAAEEIPDLHGKRRARSAGRDGDREVAAPQHRRRRRIRQQRRVLDMDEHAGGARGTGEPREERLRHVGEENE